MSSAREMQFSFRMEPEPGLVVVTCSGPLGVEDAKQGAIEYWSHPEWSGDSVVWDFRLAHFDVQPAEVREIADFILQRQSPNPPPKIALVISREVDFGLARMFEVFRENPATEVRSFRDYDEAVAWAGVPRSGGV